MSHRFARFLGFHSNPRVLFLRTAVAVFLVVFGATAITALLTPKRFTSEARLLIRYVVDNPSDIPEASRTPSAEGLTKADQIMAGEMQLIQSDAVLQRVVRSQNLEMRGRRTNANSQKLATGEEVALLRGRLKVNVPPRSSVLQLRVNSEDASEAAKTAQAIVDAYLAARIEAIHELKTENLDRAAIAEERRRERERLREELNVLNIKIVQSPTPGDLLVRPYVPGRLLMGGAGGLFLALVLGIAVTLLAKERAPAKPEESPSSGASAAA